MHLDVISQRFERFVSLILAFGTEHCQTKPAQDLCPCLITVDFIQVPSGVYFEGAGTTVRFLKNSENVEHGRLARFMVGDVLFILTDSRGVDVVVHRIKGGKV